MAAAQRLVVWLLVLAAVTSSAGLQRDVSGFLGTTRHQAGVGGGAAQLVPQVTELVISELLWLNYANPEKPVYVYIHSMGSQTPDGQARGPSRSHPWQVPPCRGLRLTCAPGSSLAAPAERCCWVPQGLQAAGLAVGIVQG